VAGFVNTVASSASRLSGKRKGPNCLAVTPAKAGVQSSESDTESFALDPGQPLRVFRGDGHFECSEFHCLCRDAIKSSIVS